MADVRSEVNRELAASQMQIHWSAVLGGSFFALGTWMFLLALGAAIQGGGGPTAWTAIYNLVAPIIALFLGGIVAARSRSLSSRFDGMLNGAVIWGFTMSVGALLIGVFGSSFGRTQGANVPSGFAWAITGSMFGSLIAALLGAASAHEHGYVGREATRGVNP